MEVFILVHFACHHYYVASHDQNFRGFLFIDSLTPVLKHDTFLSRSVVLEET